MKVGETFGVNDDSFDEDSNWNCSRKVEAELFEDLNQV